MKSVCNTLLNFLDIESKVYLAVMLKLCHVLRSATNCGIFIIGALSCAPFG